MDITVTEQGVNDAYHRCLSLRKRGYTYRDIAKMAEVSHTTVHRLVKRYPFWRPSTRTCIKILNNLPAPQRRLPGF